MPKRGNVAREAQINTKVSDAERDAIWAAVRQSRYKTISEAVRDLPRLLAYAPTEAQASGMIQTLTAAMLAVQAGLMHRVGEVEAARAVPAELANFARNVVMLMREQMGAQVHAGVERVEIDPMHPMIVHRVAADTGDPIDPRSLLEEALSSLLHSAETARAVAAADQLVKAGN